MAIYERSGKDYVHQGVQTLPPVPELELAEIGEDSYDEPCSDSSYITTTFSRDQLYSRLSGAYSHSLATNSPTSVSGPVRSPGSRRQRHPQIIYGRPTELKSSNRRVVSLPENLPPRIIQLEAAKPNTLRIVSMPDRPRPGLSGSDISMELYEQSESSCTDMSRFSTTDSSAYHRHRGYPRDIPETPSPPSSPESIMIISNNSHVPLSFLRQKSDLHDMDSDDNGSVFCPS